ncbi:MAG: tocopherol cyclase family protein [Dermatophilus congolensis]|nr:tocopherol cyclase family protein [Dermatophilus congolensis]
MLSRLHSQYRATGADLPFGDPLRAHGVAMEGYFWRVTDRRRQRSIIALIGVNRGPRGTWATLGFAAHSTGSAASSETAPTARAHVECASNGGDPSSVLALDAHPGAWADPRRLGARAGEAFVASRDRVHVDLGEGARLDLRVTEPKPWPRRRFGGSSVFHAIPALNQYWHPWLLGGCAHGTAVVGGETWDLDGCEVYAEKNWGAEGFPDAWWWGQAHGFDDEGACVAFAGGQVTAGPFATEVTALVVRLPDGTVVRAGNPVVSPVRAAVTDERWRLRGRTGRWRLDVDAEAPLRAAHVLPVPLPSEHRNTAGAIEHLSGRLSVRVRHGSRLVWQGTSTVAGLEHGGLARAEAELRRRGAPPGAVGASPQ